MENDDSSPRSVPPSSSPGSASPSSSPRSAPPRASDSPSPAGSSRLALAFAHVREAARDAAFALARELAAWRASRERVIFAAQAVLSVALAVLLTHALHLPNSWWAAFSGYAVIQEGFGRFARHGLHCMIGVVLGAALGVLVGYWTGGLLWLFVPVCGVIAAVSVYRSIGSEAGYAWILGTVTALWVAFGARLPQSMMVSVGFAALRVAEVIAGVFAGALVLALFHLRLAQHVHAAQASGTASGLMRADWLAGLAHAAHGVFASSAVKDFAARSSATPSGLGPAPLITLEPASFYAARRVLSIETGVSIAILATLACVVNLPGFVQAIVTTFTVAALPAASIAQDTTRPVLEKMVQRVGGCLLAGAVAIALLPLFGSQALACMIALGLGVWVGAHLQTGTQGVSDLGRQFAIAFIMIFVQSLQWSADPLPGLLRFSGILTALVVLGGVMLASATRAGGATLRA